MRPGRMPRKYFHFRASGRGFAERFNEAGADAPEIHHMLAKCFPYMAELQ